MAPCWNAVNNSNTSRPECCRKNAPHFWRPNFQEGICAGDALSRTSSVSNKSLYSGSLNYVQGSTENCPRHPKNLIDTVICLFLSFRVINTFLAERRYVLSKNYARPQLGRCIPHSPLLPHKNFISLNSIS